MIALSTCRPIRPKPLMPIRVVMPSFLLRVYGSLLDYLPAQGSRLVRSGAAVAPTLYSVSSHGPAHSAATQRIIGPICRTKRGRPLLQRAAIPRQLTTTRRSRNRGGGGARLYACRGGERFVWLLSWRQARVPAFWPPRAGLRYWRRVQAR